jgi:AcrR family transcriptional regulator
VSVLATKERILDAAEKLFTNGGLSTSLRSITVEAGVNVAAVHYHFGSRDVLLEAVFARRVEPINRERLRRLELIEAAAAGGPPPLEQVVEAFVAPVFRRLDQPSADGPSLVQLVGRFYAESEDLVIRLLREHFGLVGKRFIEALVRALPDLEAADVAWRFHFMVGTLGYVMSGKHLLDIVPGHRLDDGNPDATVRRVVEFCVAGLRAPAGRLP